MFCANKKGSLFLREFEYRKYCDAIIPKLWREKIVFNHGKIQEWQKKSRAKTETSLLEKKRKPSSSSERTTQRKSSPLSEESLLVAFVLTKDGEISISSRAQGWWRWIPRVDKQLRSTNNAAGQTKKLHIFCYGSICECLYELTPFFALRSWQTSFSM